MKSPSVTALVYALTVYLCYILHWASNVVTVNNFWERLNITDTLSLSCFLPYKLQFKYLKKWMTLLRFFKSHSDTVMDTSNIQYFSIFNSFPFLQCPAGWFMLTLQLWRSHWLNVISMSRQGHKGLIWIICPYIHNQWMFIVTDDDVDSRTSMSDLLSCGSIRPY